ARDVPIALPSPAWQRARDRVGERDHQRAREYGYAAGATVGIEIGWGSRTAPNITSAPVTMNTRPTSRTAAAGNTPSRAEAANGASEPRIPSSNDWIAA